MQLSERIAALTTLGKQLGEQTPQLEQVVHQACINNLWFTPNGVADALTSIANNYLSEQKLHQWLNGYKVQNMPEKSKKIGLVMAGNIPLVGFHDFLCVFICGHQAQIKLSAKDSYLFPYIANLLLKINAETANYISITDRLQGFDAVIATGSNNSARYFDYYFGKYPHVIRKNRSALAILSGNETPKDLTLLGTDIFQYFGLGCRNVSKIMVPKGYDLSFLLHNLEQYAYAMQHNKYKNNYDYYYSVYLLNGMIHFASDFLILLENSAVSSPVGVLHYEFYENEDDLNNKLIEQQEQIQCIVAATGTKGNFIPFGQAQQPKLWDYADNVDTMQFLLNI